MKSQVEFLAKILGENTVSKISGVDFGIHISLETRNNIMTTNNKMGEKRYETEQKQQRHMHDRRRFCASSSMKDDYNENNKSQSMLWDHMLSNTSKTV
jgi:hypothetical protein